jgi:hypothetical protein
MRKDDMRSLVKTQGWRSVAGAVEAILEGRKLENGATIKMRPDQFSIREMWEGMVGDVEETLEAAGGESMIREEVNSTGFVATSRILIANTVLAAFNSVPTIGDQLVTDMPSKKRFETIAGFTESEGLKDVNESMPYEDSGLGEKYVTSLVGKRGRLIYVTEEAIMEDQTGQLLMRAQRIGKMASIDIEKTRIHAVLDKFGTVYKPNGTAEAMYSTAHGNLMGTAGAVTGFTTPVPLIDWSDIDEVEQFYPLSVKDDRAVGEQDPIIWNPNVLLVPNAKVATAKRIMNATEIRIRTDSGNTNTVFSNPKANMYTVLSSPFIASSGVVGANADWYLGNFKDQFFWHNVWPIQTFAQGANSQNAWERDVVAGYKVRYLGGVFAQDYRHVVKVKAA